MSVNRMFRTCPTSGLVFHEPAEKLMRWNAVAAAVSLLIGGLLAIGVVLTRWQAVHLLPPDLFYQFLTAHGLNMLVFWIIFFEIAVLYFASSTLLRSRIATPGMAWAGFWLMVIGALINNYSVFRGDSSVMFTSYVPMQASQWFYLGLILFAVGALVGVGVFFGTLVVARAERTYEGSIPLVTFGALTAAIIAVFTIASGAIILIPISQLMTATLGAGPLAGRGIDLIIYGAVIMLIAGWRPNGLLSLPWGEWAARFRGRPAARAVKG